MDRQDERGRAGPDWAGLQQITPERGESTLDRVARGLRGELGRTLLEPVPQSWEALLRRLVEAERRMKGDGNGGASWA